MHLKSIFKQAVIYLDRPTPLVLVFFLFSFAAPRFPLSLEYPLSFLVEYPGENRTGLSYMKLACVIFELCGTSYGMMILWLSSDYFFCSFALTILFCLHYIWSNISSTVLDVVYILTALYDSFFRYLHVSSLVSCS